VTSSQSEDTIAIDSPACLVAESIFIDSRHFALCEILVRTSDEETVQIKWFQILIFDFNDCDLNKFYKCEHEEVDMAKKNMLSLEDLPISLNVSDVSKALGICKANAYELCHSKNFPSMIIGRRIIVPKVAFIKWMENPDTYK